LPVLGAVNEAGSLVILSQYMPYGSLYNVLHEGSGKLKFTATMHPFAGIFSPEMKEWLIVKETMSTTMHLFTFYLESDGMSTNNDYKHFFGALSLQFC
jgi:hypothetical protein